jgi:alpha-amylase
MLNGVLLQPFHWHSTNDGSFWRWVIKESKDWKERGITAIWLPPPYKCQGGINDTGYGVYDLYDLGEFNQKGDVRTKYGTKDEFINAVKELQSLGLEVYADFVLNHRCGADETEIVSITEVDIEDRSTTIPDSTHDAEVWTKFTFANRGGKYSEFTWNHDHFIAVDHKVEGDESHKIYMLPKKSFSGEVSFELGNFDYLMGCDVDHYHPDVIHELREWAKWFFDISGVDGLRLDAVKHIPSSFYKDFINFLRAHFSQKEILAIGEYWSHSLEEINKYISDTEGTIKLFDVPLHFNFYQAAKEGNSYNLNCIFSGTLVESNPSMAVTFVDNHDTQPGQSLESWIEDWFKPIAYTLILLRKDGYPKLFCPDYYGASSPNCSLTSHKDFLDKLLFLRSNYNHGEQQDYFDHENCIAWVRLGDDNHVGKMVVVVSNGDVGRKDIKNLPPNMKFSNVINNHDDPLVEISVDGVGVFSCPAGGVAVWINVE